ncbi:MAG: ABC transporter permease [Acidobacteriaceae bacterium]|nr:ABC transporter permease [Acidobacteriaceae bacterium]
MIVPESVLQDVRYGWRTLRRNLGFTTVAVLALALGIGANTAVFTANKAVIARPVEARDAERVASVALIRQSGAADYTFSYPDYQAYRDSLHSFQGLVAFHQDLLTLSGAGGVMSQRTTAAGAVLGRLGLQPATAKKVELASTFAVSQNYFQVLGVRLLRGRGFESLRAAELIVTPAVLLSENYWQRRFGGDARVLGKTMRLNGVAVQVIGITPHDFAGTGLFVPDFWVPLTAEPLLHADGKWLESRENQCCRLFGRLASGVSLGQAQAEMTLMAEHLRGLHDPHSDVAKSATALVWRGSQFPLPLRFFHGLKLTILLIMVAAAMLLVVACANVGGLQLSRARSREHELHTRLSLGASRLRIIRQLLTESALLGVIAGTLALFLAWAFVQLMLLFYSEAVPLDYGTPTFHVTPDLGIFAYVLGISLLAGILFGLAPALVSSRASLASSARSVTSSIHARRLQDILVAAQVSLSLVLMIAGSMLIRSSMNTLNMRTGYDAKNVIDLDFQFPEGVKYTAARKLAIVRELRTRLAAVPGVIDVTSARAPDDGSSRTAAVPSGAGEASRHGAQSLLYYTFVQPNYFETLGVSMALGRGFESQTEPGRSVVLSESAAQQLWPGENPIGRSIRLGPTDERSHNQSEMVADSAAYQVIGIARDTRGVEFDGSDSRQIYLPLADEALPSRSILIRTHFDAAQVIKEIDPVISSVDPNLIATASTLQQMLHQSAPFIGASIAAMIASAIGSLGLLLALIGIYGTVTYIVALRTREVGIRIAVGAQKHDILGLILRESTRPVIFGLLVGMLGAVAASNALRGVLYGVSVVDGVSFVGMSLLFLAIALLAAYPPSRRATRVDPVVALRYE